MAKSAANARKPPRRASLSVGPKQERKGTRKRTQSEQAVNIEFGDGHQQPFARWQDLMRQLQYDIGHNFLTAVRHALFSSNIIAAKAFVAWHTSQLPECKDLVRDEMSEMRQRSDGQDIRRFIHFIFWRVASVEQRASGHLRNQIIAVVEMLDSLVSNNDWYISSNPSVSEVSSKIEALGGITKIYDKWRGIRRKEKDLQTHRRHEETAQRTGRSVDEVISLEQQRQRQHQDVRDKKNIQRFTSDVLKFADPTDKDVTWSGKENLVLFVGVKLPEAGDNALRLYEFKKAPARRILNALLHPTTPII